MDTSNKKPIIGAANIEAIGWKSTEYRKRMRKKIEEFLIKQGPPSWANDSSGLMMSIEIFEEKMFASARNEAEYIAHISAKVKTVRPLQSAQSNLLLSKSSGSDVSLQHQQKHSAVVHSMQQSVPSHSRISQLEISAKKPTSQLMGPPSSHSTKPITQANKTHLQDHQVANRIDSSRQQANQMSIKKGSEREAFLEWQERAYQRIQTIRNTYFTKLDFLFQQITNRLQQHESAPQQSKIDVEKCKQHKQILEEFFALLRVNKNQITPSFKTRIDKIEKYIHCIQYVGQPNNALLYHEEKHSADVHSVQQSVPSHSRISQLEISAKKPTLQLISPPSSGSTKQITQPNKTHLQEHQVGIRFGSSKQHANEMSIKKVSGFGNVVQQQTIGERKLPEAFVFSTPGISASPVLEDCSNVNGISPDPTVISDETSAAMERLIKVLSSISPEALMASYDEIQAVVHLNDNRIDKNLEGVNHADPETRNLTCDDFDQRGCEKSLFINSMPIRQSFLQFTGVENPCSNSVTSQENHTLLEEIKKINNRLIDAEVVIVEEKTIPSAIEGVTGHDEGGLIVELIFNAITVDVSLMPQYAFNKKSIIKPLRLLVPSSYPLCSPVILDKMPLQISKDLEDMSIRAKFKLRFSLQSLNQQLSLMDIAKLWEHCAREAICDYAKSLGGGTFSSKYGGGWETC